MASGRTEARSKAIVANVGEQQSLTSLSDTCFLHTTGLECGEGEGPGLLPPASLSFRDMGGSADSLREGSLCKHKGQAVCSSYPWSPLPPPAPQLCKTRPGHSSQRHIRLPGKGALAPADPKEAGLADPKGLVWRPRAGQGGPGVGPKEHHLGLLTVPAGAHPEGRSQK